MSSDGPSPAPLRPSVFISYASEDRAAARALRDTLTAAGLEVWYDENELGGGDAWDQKIRRQIRDCDYFMPVISATTERRKEGYFRREWRLAAERTLDMADDVLFLVPVAIDDTTESGARVPEKFVTVQWLRAPGGANTPALEALTRRLLAGEHTVAPRPPLVTRPPQPAGHSRAPLAPDAAHAAPPPMPPFPHAPEKGGVGPWLKFCAEVIWWAVTAVWLLFNRLPRWLRIILTIWLVFLLLSTCGGGSSKKSKPNETPDPKADQIDRAVSDAAEKVAAAIEQGAKQQDWGKMGEELARQFGKRVLDPSAAGKRLVLVPFAPRNATTDAARFATAVFEQCDRQLSAALLDDMAVTQGSTQNSRDAQLALGRVAGNEYVLGGRVATTGGQTQLVVQLLAVRDGTNAWQGEFPITNGDSAAAATQIVQAVLKQVPPRERP